MIIKKPTVLVLAAGLSHPYGFPLGPQLVTQILSMIRSDDETTHILYHAMMQMDSSFRIQLLGQFADELVKSRLYSIDAFLQRRPEWLTVWKATIAAVLVPAERQSLASNKAPDEEDWYRYLFNRIFPPTPEQFLENRLTIVTFNFDRSFEHALVNALKNAYPISIERATELARQLQPLHIFTAP